jgi:hypothetical protein
MHGQAVEHGMCGFKEEAWVCGLICLGASIAGLAGWLEWLAGHLHHPSADGVWLVGWL